MSEVPAVRERASVPSYIAEERLGTDNIAQEDVQIPRLALAQKMSPEADASTSKHIEGLVEGMFFNSLTQEVIGEGPIDFAVVRVEKPRAMEFFPIAEGGGVKDPNVPLNDDRLKWSTNEKTGAAVKPTATKFYDFVIVPIDADGTVQTGDVMALSLKSSGVKVAKQLNGLITLRGKRPVFAGRYTLGVKKAQNKTGQVYHTYTVNNSTANGGWVDEEAYALLKGVYEAFSTVTITVDREAGPDPEDDHAGTQVSDDKVPF